MHILFVCRGNVVRSQEAALFCSSLSGGAITAESAGIRPIIGKPINPDVVSLMQDLGFDKSKCYRKALTPQMVTAADKIVSFVASRELPEFAWSHPDVVQWHVPDPG